MNIKAVMIVENEGGGCGNDGDGLKLMEWVEVRFCDMCLRLKTAELFNPLLLNFWV